jgi:cation diffusion facilitator family transporter
MSEACCGKAGAAPVDPMVRRILWIVLIANAAMFGVETFVGHAAGSVSLQADALDFGADAATYGITLLAIGRSLAARTRAALIKSAAMLLMGLVILAMAVAKVLTQAPPEAVPMGVVGAMALAVNLGAVLLLLRFRNGDANLRSVWLCSRNDALGNVLVIGAAGLTVATQSHWPDLAVGIVMCALFLTRSLSVFKQARQEAALAKPQPLLN